MKKVFVLLCVVGAMLAAGAITVSAEVGNTGFFGGITEGVRLPKTTEILLANASSGSKNAAIELPYKEIVFLTGRPVEFSGTLTIRPSGSATAESGTYRVVYTVRASDSTAAGVNIARTITFNVNYRKQGKQVVKDYTVASWTETITADGATFVLDSKQSHFDVSILEDHVAGVSYYKGDLSQKAVYRGNTGTSLELSGSIYGFTSAWSSAEVHRLDGRVYANDYQLQYQVRPSVSVDKTLQYSANEPTAISFAGNYREVMANQSGLQYDITVLPARFQDVVRSGGATISTYNTFEQLMAPDVSFLKGHFAEADVSKLFAMGVLEGDAKFFQPSQQITRGQFVTMLVKALKLPIDTSYQNQTGRTKNNVTVNVVFPDVMPDRADFPYIMAAYNAGLAIGRGNGHFQVDSPIERQEAFVLLVRALGLSNLGLEPTPITPYMDDASISSWAKKDIYAGSRIGLFKGDTRGNVNPHANVSKAEAAAIVNRLVEYMRTGLRLDYTEHIVNY